MSWESDGCSDRCPGDEMIVQTDVLGMRWFLRKMPWGLDGCSDRCPGDEMVVLTDVLGMRWLF